MNEIKTGSRMIVVSLIGIKKKLRMFFRLLAIILIIVLGMSFFFKLTAAKETKKQPVNSGTLIQLNEEHNLLLINDNKV
ncbi:MAG: hypothetical protein ACI3ZR_05660 [bacterium]